MIISLPAGRIVLALAAAITLSNAPAAERAYRLAPEASEARAKVAFFGLAHKTARFPDLRGSVRIDPDRPEQARIEVTIDARTLEAPDRTTLNRLRGERFFWVEKYPVVRFVGSGIALSTPTRGKVSGMLTARGISKPQVLNVEFAVDPARTPPGSPIDLVATTRIDRRDYGMNSYQLIVGNKVDITLNARMVPH